MKILYPDVTALVDTGDAQTDAEFPVSNAVNHHLLKKWRASVGGAVNSVYFDLQAVGAVDTVGLFGLNIDGVTIDVYSDAGYSSPVETQTIPCTVAYSFGSVPLRNVWAKITEQSQAWIRITVDTTSNKAPEIGVISLGKSLVYRNPKGGQSDNIKDFSRTRETISGSLHVRPKNHARIPSLEIMIPKADINDYYEIQALYSMVKTDSIAVLLADDLEDEAGATLNHKNAIWCKFSAPPTFVKALISHHTVRMDFQEDL